MFDNLLLQAKTERQPVKETHKNKTSLKTDKLFCTTAKSEQF